MGQFKLTILGCNSAVPAKRRYPTSQLLEWGGYSCLIDCGEGTQMRFIELGVKRSKISHIFISHLHGDHIFGLPGLVNSYILTGRTAPLKIFGPVGLRRYLDVSVDFDRIPSNFMLEVVEMEDAFEGELVSFGGIKVSAVQLMHKITTFGYVFREYNLCRKLNKKKVEAVGFEVSEIKELVNGKDVYRQDGTVFRNVDYTLKEESPASYGYCSDTVFSPPLGNAYYGVSCLYHESTFLEDMKEQAEKRFHSTAAQAAEIARLSSARALILGHFSNRYGNLEAFRTEGSAIFKPIYIGETGKQFKISAEGVVSEEKLKT